MIPNKVLIQRLLHQAAAELTETLIASLPPPNECQHKFSDSFEEKMQSLIRGIGAKCYTVAIQDSIIHK